MKSPLAMLFAGFAFSTQVHAAPDLTEDVRARIANAVERYASAIACAGVRVQPGNVYLLDPGRLDDRLPKYAVLWTGDIRCQGGSGTEATHLAIATVNTGQYVVQPELSSPVIRFDSPVRFVTRVVSAASDTLILEGNEYAPADPRSHPTVPVRFTLRAHRDGHWKLTDKIHLDKVTDAHGNH
jgi:hypothetical protein